MFHVHAFNPHPLLTHCVDSYLIVSFDQKKGFIERNFYPHVTQSLVFGLDEVDTVYDCSHSEFSAPHFIVGPNDEVCRVRMYHGMKKMIINFKPGGFYKIFHLPAQQFNNRSQDALKFLGEQITEISKQLREVHLSRKIELTNAWL